MRYLLASVLLVGCSTTKPTPPAPVIINNKDKDTYIEKVETVISDTASALTAVAPSVPAGVSRELVENQVTRLSGISKPTVERTDNYRKILQSNDQEAVKKDKEEALKVDSETQKLWAIVEEQETAIAIANEIAENAEKQHQLELKEKILWKFSTAGLAMFVLGLAVVAFTPFKKNGGIFMAGGSLAMASMWIFDSKWFTWIVGVSIGLVIGSIVLAIISHIRPRPEVRDTPQDKEEKPV
jgi:hypothetical protein